MLARSQNRRPTDAELSLTRPTSEKSDRDWDLVRLGTFQERGELRDFLEASRRCGDSGRGLNEIVECHRPMPRAMTAANAGIRTTTAVSPSTNVRAARISASPGTKPGFAFALFRQRRIRSVGA